MPPLQKRGLRRHSMGAAAEEGERSTEGRMRCGHYRGGVAEGEGEDSASFWRHVPAPAGGAAPLRSCRAVGRVSRTGVTRHRSPHAARRGRQET